MKLKGIIKVLLVLVENGVFSAFPKLRPLIERYGFNPLDFRSDHTEYSQRKFKEFQSAHREFQFLNGKTLLELGPGGSIGFGLLALKNGLTRYLAIDDGTHTFINCRLLKEYHHLLENDEKLFKSAFVKGEDGITRYRQPTIVFKEINQNAGYPLSDNSVDIIYSCAVLEHVHDLEHCFSEMTRVLKSESIMYHEVDLRDHIFDQKSLWFLTIPSHWFRLFFSQTGGYVNRARISTYKTLAKKFGFSILSLSVQKQFNGKSFPKSLVHLSPADREVLTFSFVLKKIS